MNKKTMKIFFLVTLLILLVGVVSASEINETCPATTKEVKETQKVTNTNVTKIVTKKDIANKTDNVKTGTQKNSTKLTLNLNKNKAILNDKIQITVTLKDNKNKAIKNQNITVKIGSKYYTLKTNTKGVAKLNYKVTNNNVLGKQILAKYKGNSKYKSSLTGKVLASDEQAYYTKKMTAIGKDTDNIESKLDKTLSKIDFEKYMTTKTYNEITSSLNSIIKSMNNDITKLKDLKKYTANKYRKTYIDINIESFEITKQMCSCFKAYAKDFKDFCDYKTSEKTATSRLSNTDKKVDSLMKKGDALDKKAEAFEKKHPIVIKGIEKYFT